MVPTQGFPHPEGVLPAYITADLRRHLADTVVVWLDHLLNPAGYQP